MHGEVPTVIVIYIHTYLLHVLYIGTCVLAIARDPVKKDPQGHGHTFRGKKIDNTSIEKNDFEFDF